jgi:hypothetical protein
MRYSSGELSWNARILHVVTTLVFIVYVLAGLVAAGAATFWLNQYAVSTTVKIAAFVAAFIYWVAVGLLVIAPMRLVIEVALCASQIEETTASQLAVLNSLHERLQRSELSGSKPSTGNGGERTVVAPSVIVDRAP